MQSTALPPSRSRFPLAIAPAPPAVRPQPFRRCSIGTKSCTASTRLMLLLWSNLVGLLQMSAPAPIPCSSRIPLQAACGARTLAVANAATAASPRPKPAGPQEHNAPAICCPCSCRKLPVGTRTHDDDAVALSLPCPQCHALPAVTVTCALTATWSLHFAGSVCCFSSLQLSIPQQVRICVATTLHCTARCHWNPWLAVMMSDHGECDDRRLWL